MPQIDETPYNDMISSFNAYINTHGDNTDRNQSTDLTLTGNIIGCRNFSTSGNITISGNGYIVASRNIKLHSLNASSGTLNISPSGGNIYFLAGRSLIVNSNRNDTNVNINPSGAYLYSMAQNNSQLVRVRRHNTTTTDIEGAFIMGRRRVIIEDGAQVKNSTIYVSDVSNQNNYLQIRDNGTYVSGIIISVSGRSPGMIITGNPTIEGLVYHWGDTSGTARIADSTINGSVIASRFTNNRISNTDINYQAVDVTDTLPVSFDGEVYVIPGSWNDE
jgi:hypothetical protein